MKETEAENLANLLNEIKIHKSKSFIIEESIIGHAVEDFHQWSDNKKQIGSFLIRRSEDNQAFWFQLIEWNPKDVFYLIIFPENRKGPLIEIHKLESNDFEWRYKPTKHDGKNPERKEYFTKFFGNVEVTISEPLSFNEIIDFIDDIFHLTEVRIKSDELSKNLPAEREVFHEGRRVERKHYARERSSKLISFVKSKFKEKYGTFFCQICDFNFEEKYGERGKDFIEAHHTRPLSELDKKGGKTKPEEIVLVCANCHRMIHKTRPWLKINELKIIVK